MPKTRQQIVSFFSLFFVNKDSVKFFRMRYFEMSEMNERVFNCCPPPHQCPSHHCSSHDRITMGEWMHYINTYIDVRARQIYDKLKALIPTSSGVVNKIIAGDNITVTPESG